MSSLSDFAGLMTYRYSSLFIEDFFQPNNFKKIRNISDLSNLDSQNNILDFIIHTENLEADLIRVLTESGYPLDQEIKQAIHQHADNRINTSQHEKYVYYHDQETINLIAEKDRLIIEKYGYTSPNIVGLR